MPCKPRSQAVSSVTALRVRVSADDFEIVRTRRARKQAGKSMLGRSCSIVIPEQRSGRALHQDDMAANLSRNPDPLAALWTDDGVLLTPGNVSVIGTQTIREGAARMMTDHPAPPTTCCVRRLAYPGRGGSSSSRNACPSACLRVLPSNDRMTGTSVRSASRHRCFASSSAWVPLSG